LHLVALQTSPGGDPFPEKTGGVARVADKPGFAGGARSTMTALPTDVLTQLGRPAELPASPDRAGLETVANPHPDRVYLVRFTCPEFTCLCPVTGQPDFAHLVIDYVPAALLIESKSLKLFLGSFRNHGGFHEGCTILIAKRLEQALAPAWLRIGGYWYPRGGMPIDVFYQSGPPPAGLWLPDQGVAPYRGRG
jgi:7-cyano-7-deazaguanine reductase